MSSTNPAQVAKRYKLYGRDIEILGAAERHLKDKRESDDGVGDGSGAG